MLHSVVHMCDFRRNSYHSGSHRGSSSSCAGAHVDEILNYLKSVTNLGSHLPRISASNQPWGRVEPSGPSDRMDLFDAGAQDHCSEFSHILLIY